MAEYFERDSVIDLITRRYENPEICTQEINSIPAADVAPVVHGRWEPCFDENCRCLWGFGKCSNCGQEYYAHAIDHYKYCPICGAKMDGGNDNEAD